MEQCIVELNGRKYILDLQPVEFEIWRDRNIKGKPCLCLSWRQETQFKNIVFLRFLVLHIGPPWIVYQAAVVNRDEPLEET